MLRHPIELLQLNKKKENQFLSKGLSTVEDIAYYFPENILIFALSHLQKMLCRVITTLWLESWSQST